MDSFSSPSTGSSSKFSADDLMDQLKLQLAQAYAEEFLETVRGKCFDKCITKPGSSLSGGESSCISRCVERYIEATGCGRTLKAMALRSSRFNHLPPLKYGTYKINREIVLYLDAIQDIPEPTAENEKQLVMDNDAIFEANDWETIFQIVDNVVDEIRSQQPFVEGAEDDAVRGGEGDTVKGGEGEGLRQ
ncbi:Mitochondrial import inner membrane translocase subunit Tim13 [Sesamum alatum]|uniref:Mitochondrial import inner membrane translocase subunit Tim13 n=1 Tax=Sesamum alatum TaxID=300844 RepID=A0AAE2CIB0_9LAMI|nr:Mitochondrial import inner membrane translocase subunit Tim13 [Sesamum alatum]